jgi:hypothetical protein
MYSDNGQVTSIVLNLTEHLSGRTKEGIAIWEGLWKLVPPTEMGRETIASRNCVGEYGSSTRCVRKDWYNSSTSKVNGEFQCYRLGKLVLLKLCKTLVVK